MILRRPVTELGRSHLSEVQSRATSDILRRKTPHIDSSSIDSQEIVFPIILEVHLLVETEQ